MNLIELTERDKQRRAREKMRILKDACERVFVGGENLGICAECDNVQGGCEPDAEKYKCETCGEHKVYGVELIAEKMLGLMR